MVTWNNEQVEVDLELMNRPWEASKISWHQVIEREIG